jgi:hypothetical protein
VREVNDEAARRTIAFEAVRRAAPVVEPHLVRRRVLDQPAMHLQTVTSIAG